MEGKETTTPTRDDQVVAQPSPPSIPYDGVIARRDEWKRKGHTMIDPEILNMIERYRSAAGQIGKKPDTSEAINYLLSRYSGQIDDEINEIDTIANRHK